MRDDRQSAYTPRIRTVLPSRPSCQLYPATSAYLCPQWDSNPHCADSKSAASANWAMGALQLREYFPVDGYCPGGCSKGDRSLLQPIPAGGSTPVNRYSRLTRSVHALTTYMLLWPAPSVMTTRASANSAAPS